ncbi:MAG: substrate-binding domain-containing protein [Ruminococcus sp.]
MTEDMIFYGDFWKAAGKQLGQAIADGGVVLPEAVACANTCMAETLIAALQRNRIRVPEDIAVVGYDPFFNNVLNVPSITCMANMNYNQGSAVFAVCTIG